MDQFYKLEFADAKRVKEVFKYINGWLTGRTMRKKVRINFPGFERSFFDILSYQQSQKTLFGG